MTDTERLDWLERQFADGGWVHFDRYGPGSWGCAASCKNTGPRRGGGIRGSIDAAYKADLEASNASHTTTCNLPLEY